MSPLFWLAQLVSQNPHRVRGVEIRDIQFLEDVDYVRYGAA
jgi:hypothetical protein